MALNSNQATTAQDIFRFLMSDDKEFNIKGPAGVGKTYLLDHIMRVTITQYEDTCNILGIKPIEYTVALTATTNKAADVLTKSTGYPASTIHSFLGLKVFDDYRTGKSQISKTASWIVHTRTLIFIDEASMIDTTLHNFIKESTDKTCKIVYVGDHNQLAPLGEKISPIYVDEKYQSVLSEPVRNAEQPALITLCQQLRETVESGIFKPIQEVPGIIDYVDGNTFKNLVDTNFINYDHNNKILCHTNIKVKEYNDYIRNLRGLSDMFSVGERLVNNKVINLSKKNLKVEEIVEVVNVKPNIFEFAVNENDPSVVMDVYTITIRRNTGVDYVFNIPYNKEHYDALIKHYKSVKEWKPYFHLLNHYPDLRPIDASTVHKSQGSTYHTVYVDLDNIGNCDNPNDVARMLYVAFSRPTTRLYLYGKLPGHYIGD